MLTDIHGRFLGPAWILDLIRKYWSSFLLLKCVLIGKAATFWCVNWQAISNLKYCFHSCVILQCTFLKYKQNEFYCRNKTKWYLLITDKLVYALLSESAFTCFGNMWRLKIANNNSESGLLGFSSPPPPFFHHQLYIFINKFFMQKCHNIPGLTSALEIWL